MSDPIAMQERPVRSTFFDVDGAIVDHSKRSDLLPLLERGIPLVNLRTCPDVPEAGHVSNDATAIARMAIDHFAERQFKHLAFCEWQRRGSDIRRRRFEEELDRRQMQGHVYLAKSRTPGNDKDMRLLGEWLEALPKPVGILAHNDVRGRMLIDACALTGLSVPEEVAVLGVDDELPYCMMCQPQLSSVRVDAERIGFEAAAMLNRMIDGEPAPEAPHLVAPTHIVERESTKTLAVSDAVVIAAVTFIRERACDGIQVDDVLDHVGASRSVLERRMKSALGRTPHEEIVRVKIERATEMLRDSDLPHITIAERCGFNYVESMSRLFRSRLNLTPGQVRNRSRY